MGLSAEVVFFQIVLKRQEVSERPNGIVSCKIIYLLFKSLLEKNDVIYYNCFI